MDERGKRDAVRMLYLLLLLAKDMKDINMSGLKTRRTSHVCGKRKSARRKELQSVIDCKIGVGSLQQRLGKKGLSNEKYLLTKRGSLFKPAFIASLGSFQDGGLRHNNPTDLALWECNKLWSTPTQPDVVLSLGTGTANNLKSPKAPHFRELFTDGFIPRLCRSFMSSIDGERAWRDITNRFDDATKADYFRLNIPFDDAAEPLLDDLECIDTLRQSVHLQPQGSRDRAEVASALLVASLYFELDTLPKYEFGQYFCTGIIRCRNDFDGVLKSLARIHTKQLEFATETENLGALTIDDICHNCRLYHKKIRFHVRHLEDTVSLFVKINDLERRKISGFPHSMQWFIKQQQLDAPFGKIDHDRAILSKEELCIYQKAHRDACRVPMKRGANWPDKSSKRIRRA